MGISIKIDKAWLESVKNKAHDRFKSVALYRLNVLGQQCVDIARSLDTYKDQTANLRNSIGYVVAHFGQIVHEDFQGTGIRGVKYEGGITGEQIAKAYAQDLINKLSKNEFVLIVVAGMEYASYVEDVHNLEVLNPAKQFAEQDAQNVARDIVESFKTIKL